MALKTNLTDLTPGREKFKQEIQLISGGYSCPKAFPNGKITVYPWDNEVDTWLVERSRRAGNQVTWELLKKVSDLNGCPVEDFVLGDLNTVLMVSRAITSNNIISLSPVCPHCRVENKPAEIRIPDELEKLGEKKLDYQGFDNVILPVSKDVVSFRPAQVKDEIQISETDDAKKMEMGGEDAMRALMLVTAVGGGAPDSLKELVTWWRALHPSDREFLLLEQDRLTPHLNQNVMFKCDFCFRDFDYKLKIDRDFFR
jgi:hypothetical protein